jgi:hypothetical protein
VKTDIQTAAPSLNGSKRLSAASPAPRPLNNSPELPKAKGVSTAKATGGSKTKHAGQRPSRASRSASKPESWSAAIAAAMIWRRPSSSGATPAAAAASKSAMVRPRAPRLRKLPARRSQKGRSSSGANANRLTGPVSSREYGPIALTGVKDERTCATTANRSPAQITGTPIACSCIAHGSGRSTLRLSPITGQVRRLTAFDNHLDHFRRQKAERKPAAH